MPNLFGGAKEKLYLRYVSNLEYIPTGLGEFEFQLEILRILCRASVEFKYPDSCREHFIHLLCLRPTATRRMQRLFAMC